MRDEEYLMNELNRFEEWVEKYVEDDILADSLYSLVTFLRELILAI